MLIAINQRKAFKMFTIKSEIVWFFIFIHVSNCQRRIEEGQEAKTDKPYVVYLVKAPLAKNGYDFWLCGGALVTSDFVVTSAACIKDVEFLYVIAGYKKYVIDDDIETDPCTSKMKKKVIFTCYPEGYELKYERLEKWSLIDIGVAKVESPFNFEDNSFKTLCSYTPDVIPIGYDAKHQEPGTDAVVFGWGHLNNWRKPEDTTNYNQATLNYAPVMIIDKEECKSQYEEHEKMVDVIDTYMICTLGPGHIDENGDPIEPPDQDDKHFLTVCTKRKSWSNNPGDPVEECEEYYNDGSHEYDETRREINKSNSSINKITKIKNKMKSLTRATNNGTFESKRINRTRLTKTTINGTSLDRKTLTLNNKTASFMSYNKTGVLNETLRDSRRYGICQNDHGGPLVTWVGGREILIGVASVFKVAEDYKCIGPFLYTSTQCNGAFLDCILTQSNFDNGMLDRAGTSDNRHRRSFCKKSEDDEKHPTIERHISWLSHPAGPADHEKHLKQEKKEPEAKERVKNDEIVKQSARHEKLPNTQNRPYEKIASNKKSLVNVNNNAPSNFKMNDDRNAPKPNEDNTGLNNKYGNNYPHGPAGLPVKTNFQYRYTPYNAPVSNNGPAQETLKRFEQSYKIKSNFAHAYMAEPAAKEPAQIIEPALYGRPASNNMAKANFMPASNNNMAASNIMPASNNNYMPASNIMPASNNNYMPTSNIRPASNNNNMPASNIMPASNNNYMPASNIMPASNNNYMPTSNIRPASNNNNMAASNIMPASNNNMPTSNNRPKPKNMQEALRFMESSGAKLLMRPQARLHN